MRHERTNERTNERTIVLPPALARRVRGVAALERLTVRELVLIAVRECLRAYPPAGVQPRRRPRVVESAIAADVAPAPLIEQETFAMNLQGEEVA